MGSVTDNAGEGTKDPRQLPIANLNVPRKGDFVSWKRGQADVHQLDS